MMQGFYLKKQGGYIRTFTLQRAADLAICNAFLFIAIGRSEKKLIKF
jgi:hypothetical protein